MNDIQARLRPAVVLRAGNRCEYCGLAQEVQEATSHIDHRLRIKAIRALQKKRGSHPPVR